MVFLQKSQPEPACLLAEKAKANGDYKCDDVLDRIKLDFQNKCYICEYKEPVAINIEHFTPHLGDKELKFDWNNLFWSCSHCNNTKSVNYNNILNCTNSSHFIGIKLKYLFKPFPYEKVLIEELVNTPEVIETKKLLEAVYNGTTKLKTIESANLRNKLLEEIKDFQKYLCDYFEDTNSDDDRKYFLIKIKKHLNRGSNFTAFKRWIIFENEVLYHEFSEFID
jgi:hypothetical protein